MNSELLENEIYYNENDELCLNCGNLYTHVEVDKFENIRWCKKCSVKYVQNNICDWSGNKKIDDFIKSQQQKARSPYEFFEWIPYEKFEKVTQIGKGGFATIYSANWIKGILRHYNEEDNGFFRYDDVVALKCLHDSEDINESFLNEVGFYPFEFQDKGVLRCFGISQNPQTKEYVMVLELMMGNLCDWLNSDYNKHNWVDNLFLLHQIIKGLNNIHMKGLIHRDFHPGNLLMRDISSKYAYISDLGLSGPADNGKQSNDEIFGVLPYLPPEVLLGKPYTQAADIYGLGMIMYLIATGNQPFNDVAHDYLLSIDICNGMRPKIKREGIPPFYLEMMENCWDQDPSKRKSSKELYELSLNWFLHKKLEIKDEILDQVKVYDEFLSKLAADKQKQRLNNSQAIYTSRIISIMSLDDFKI